LFFDEEEKTLLIRIAVMVGAALALPLSVQAQPWPSKPIRYIVPFAPGGTTDILGRLVGKGLTDTLGQQVIVDNRPGQAGSLGAAELARATPDGHTLGGGTISSHAINVSL
jgi:tripartite-type tricarboxylate transporter receptor subunit TctC